MAKKAAGKETVSLKKLRGALNDSQKRFINLLWKHFLEHGQWPDTFDIHRKHSPDEIANSLNPLGGDVVWENNYSEGNRYELRPIGVLLTKDGEEYENWLVRLIEFLRSKYLQADKDEIQNEFDDVEIGQTLGLSDEQLELLGTLTRFQSVYRSYGHTTGGHWKIQLPKEIQTIPRTGSLASYYEALLFKHFKRNTPVLEKDRANLHMGNAHSFPQLERSLYPQVFEPPKKTKVRSPKAAKIFVSHSAQDKELVQALTDLLKTAFRLPAKDIPCTSVPGHKLAGGADTEEELLALLRDSHLLIGVLTPASLSSSYVLFELGARWGLQKPHIPLIASGARMADIKEPLKAKNALDAADEDDVYQLVQDVARYLGRKSEPTPAYNAKVRQLVSVAKSRRIQQPINNPSAPTPEATKLDWVKLIERITLETQSIKAGYMVFHDLAKRRGLKPFVEAPRNAMWRSVTCAGALLTERNASRSFLLEEASTEKACLEYEFEISPALLEKTAPLIETWYNRIKDSSPLKLVIHFSDHVTLENEIQRITANIFETELSMTNRDMFEFGKHWFSLRPRKHSSNPMLEMTVRKKFSLIPWAEIFTALVRRRVLIVSKPLAKEIWI